MIGSNVFFFAYRKCTLRTVRKLFLAPTISALVECHQLINGDEKVTDICSFVGVTSGCKPIN